jgi:glycosyltransferase involved in cell wall biosynthesis
VDGELRDAVRATINQRGVGDICKLYPWMEPLHAYLAADLVVMPSLFESYGFVAAEAIATGCLCRGGVPRQCANDSRRRLCEIETEKFVDQLLRVIDAPEKLAGMRLARANSRSPNSR